MILSLQATGIVAMGFLDLKRSGVRGQVSEHSAKIMKTGVGKMMRDGAKKITAAVPILPGKSLRPTFDPDAAVQKMKWSRYLFVLSATGLHYYRTKNGRDALFKEHKGTILREDIAGMYVRSSVQAVSYKTALLELSSSVSLSLFLSLSLSSFPHGNGGDPTIRRVLSLHANHTRMFCYTTTASSCI